MSASAEFVAYTKDQLSALGPLGEGVFFGGFAFRKDGVQFAMVMGNTLYLRVDDLSRPHFEAQDMSAFSYMTRRGRVRVKTYYAVPEMVLEDSDTLVHWAREALRAASAKSK